MARTSKGHGLCSWARPLDTVCRYPTRFCGVTQVGEALSRCHLSPCRKNPAAQDPIEDTFTGLFGGLFLLSCHEFGRRQLPGAELLSASLRDRLGLSKIPAASTLLEALRRDAVPESPIWHHMDTSEIARTFGLPDGAMALLGMGY